MRRTTQVLLGFFRFFFFFLLEELQRWLPVVRHVKKERKNPERLRLYLTEMGGAFIKFGQFFSIRSDILPPIYCRQLSQLYDNVPPFDGEIAISIIEEELGAPISELFSRFDVVPVGAASFAQGHVAVLKEGDDAGKTVILKIARPGSEERIDIDCRLLLLLGWIVDVSSVLGHIKLRPVFRDFARWTRREINYLQEAKNADHIYEMTEWNTRQRIPYIYWDYCTRRIICMEYLDGLPFSRVISRFECGDPELDLELGDCDSDRLVLARNLWQSFMLQTFAGRVFHADPHPGNLIVLPENTIGFLDFGLLGRLNEEGRREQMLLNEAVVIENIERMFMAVLDILDAPRGLAVTDFYEGFTEEADEWLDACDNPGATMEEKTITRLVDAAMSIARQIGLVLPMQTMLYFKALLTIDNVILRMCPEFDYKKETARAMRLVRLRLLEEMYSPGAVIDRALSIQLLANTAPDFLVQRLQDFQQGQKSIYRKLNLFQIFVANTFKLLAWLVAASWALLLVRQLGWIALPGLDLSVLDGFLDSMAWLLYVVPVLVVVLYWASRMAMSHSYQRVQKTSE